MEERTAELSRVRPLRIAYTRSGSGPAVVLLHGLGASSTAWHYQARRLSEAHTVFAVDLPGFGRSPAPPSPLDGEQAAEVVAEFIEREVAASADLVGHSMGGAVALLVSLRHPELVRSLTLVASAGLGHDIPLLLRLLCLPGADRLLHVVGPALVRALARVSGLRRRLATATDADVIAPVLAEAFQRYRSRERVRTFTEALRAGASFHGQLPRYVLRDRLAELKIPVLLVWGRYDSVLPIDHGLRAAAGASRNSRLAILHCGHSPMLEAAAAFTDLLNDFLSSLTPTPAVA